MRKKRTELCEEKKRNKVKTGYMWKYTLKVCGHPNIKIVPCNY